MSEQSETVGTDADDASEAQRKSQRVRWMLGLVAIFVVAGLVYGLYWYFIARFAVGTQDAYVHGNRIALMPRIEGTVTAIAVDDTDFVTRGQTLVTLDGSDARLALNQAKADLAQTLREVQERYIDIEQQRSILAQGQATLRQAQRDFDRARALYKTRTVSKAFFQQAQAEAQTAAAGVQAARHQLEALMAQTQGIDPAHHPQVLSAAQQVRRAWLNLQRTTIVAPVGGHIAQRSVQVGQQVEPGMPLLAIVPLEQVWVEANFKETDMQRVRIGQPVTIRADFYGGDVTYKGEVRGLSAGTGSAFELLPPQNATGNWIKVVQRLPVRIALDAQQIEKHPLRIGLSLTATIDVRDASGPLLIDKASTRERYKTSVYHLDPAPVDAMIDMIVRDNLLPDSPAAALGNGR